MRAHTLHPIVSIPWKAWLRRLLLLVLIAPGSFALFFMAFVAMGLFSMGEAGGYTTTRMENAGGALVMIGLAALWTLTATGSGARFSPARRGGLCFAMLAGIPGVPLIIIGDPDLSLGWIFFLVVPLVPLMVAGFHAIRIYRSERRVL